MNDKNIVISFQSMLVFIGTLMALWVVWHIRGIILILFVAYIIALTLEPTIEWLERKNISRPFGVAFTVVLLILIFIGFASVAIIPVQQISVLLFSLPNYLDALLKSPVMADFQLQLSNAIYGQISQSTGSVISATIGAFSGLLNIFVILVFVVYMLLDFRNLRSMVVRLFPKNRQKDVGNVMSRIEIKLGGWLRGQLLLMLIIGVTTYIGLTILGIDYALALGVIAGILEVVPIIGPIASAIPAIIVAFNISPIAGLGIIGLYALIQQMENSFLVPKVMQRAVGFNPLVTIIALMVGGSLLGLVGTILAIPITIVGVEVVKYFLYENH